MILDGFLYLESGVALRHWLSRTRKKITPITKKLFDRLEANVQKISQISELKCVNMHQVMIF